MVNTGRIFYYKKRIQFKNIPAFSFACANHTQKVVYKIQANGYSVEPVNYTGKKIADAWKSSFLIYSISKGNGSFKPSAHPLSQINDDFLIQQHQHFVVEYTNDEK